MNIGLTQRVLYHNGVGYDCLDNSFYRMFKGHTLTAIPNIYDLNYLQTITDIDMLVITGGDSDSTRMHNEVNLIMRAMIAGKPILGICHGAFLLTQMLGGETKDSDKHMNTPHPITHMPTKKEYIVNSFHRSVITKEPKDAEVVAFDSEGNIECWVKSNIAAIVWHPERNTNYIDTFIPPEVMNLYDKSSETSIRTDN